MDGSFKKLNILKKLKPEQQLAEFITLFHNSEKYPEDKREIIIRNAFQGLKKEYQTEAFSIVLNSPIYKKWQNYNQSFFLEGTFPSLSKKVAGEFFKHIVSSPEFKKWMPAQQLFMKEALDTIAKADLPQTMDLVLASKMYQKYLTDREKQQFIHDVFTKISNRNRSAVLNTLLQSENYNTLKAKDQEYFAREANTYRPAEINEKFLTKQFEEGRVYVLTPEGSVNPGYGILMEFNVKGGMKYSGGCQRTGLKPAEIKERYYWGARPDRPDQVQKIAAVCNRVAADDRFSKEIQAVAKKAFKDLKGDENFKARPFAFVFVDDKAQKPDEPAL